MVIDPYNDVGVLIEGDAEELQALAEAIGDAAEHGEAEGQLLQDEGVQRIVIRLEES